ncbi:hypothetical protein OKW21_001903 [Catalinimonas alkaloidigena]|uniref:hypothetical protein n=1 Tax=Catalinimonas alkaloidigena TaxID=1075417 RepID=UPI00240753C6|nr:hypothetical protein [Catalinimonas alkaloidigena]MDF9796640.1 hypothetical protein [Catalinimonas alkaloidigena]
MKNLCLIPGLRLVPGWNGSQKLKVKYLLLSISLFLIASTTYAGEPDLPFEQAVSVKFTLSEDLEGARLQKVVVDYDDVVHVLSDQGLLSIIEGEMVKNIGYRPLADKKPVDIAIQEESGYLYYLYEDQWLTNAHAGIPHGNLTAGTFDRLAVNHNGAVLLSGPKAMAKYANGEMKKLKHPGENILDVQTHRGQFYVLGDKQLYRLEGEKLSPLHQGDEVSSMTFREDEIVLGTSNGYYGISCLDGTHTFTQFNKVPVPEITGLTTTSDGLWAASDQGAYMRQQDGSFRYYASRRWLDQDKVIDMAADSKGNMYLLTETGLNQVKFKSQTLAEKAAYFENKIRKRHIRYGFIAEMRLSEPGNIATAEMIDTDNDGLWSSFYLGSQVFRYAVTGEEKARRNAWECFEAFERLLSVNQLEGFPSRTFERKGYKVSDADRWRDAPEPEWEWKGHTSSDEFVAYIYIASLMDEFLSHTESEKKRVADFMDAILSHIIENDYYFVDIDGKPTLWGRWNPEYINWYPRTVRDRRLGSLHLIAGLQLGYDLTGKEIYKEEAFRMMNEHGYLDNIKIAMEEIKSTPGYIYEGHNMGEGGWNHSDDEMAFLTYWVIHRHAFNDTLKQVYEESIHNHWAIEKPERNAVWNLITLATEGTFDEESTLWFLKDYPMDLVRYTVKNSHRKDLTFLEPNFREQMTKELLPQAERPIMRFNANPFKMDGGSDGKRELTGAEFLLPYWMARYYQIIEG